MTYKALIHTHYTKRDTFGNVYRVAVITNPKTGKAFNTTTPSISNIVHVLNNAFPGYNRYYITEACTESTRLSSLPDGLHLNDCRLTEDWRSALRSIGYRIPKEAKS